MGDTWDDGDLLHVFQYLLESESTSVPDSWWNTMQRFAEELKSAVTADQQLVQQYMSLRGPA